ncbi:hypothetical protein [Desulfosporosinus youngiae]|uniref:Uncharacterized protein n=1 Tax=Desulfosporosinus youngiae DSM 17734 TaxID=768710 RepID=H5Y4Q3_9FIRM|nr:hypothetical protein [Desulfosporosinus youngiae]EHQ89789.1 hypothetical protein DesyoDRAFT_2735 [Desulfosporosinus youngiae DSM 17734]
MKLYALKCRGQYLKVSDREGYQWVDLDKASVFPPEKFPVIEEYLEEVKKRGLRDVRIVELIVTESAVE